MTNGYVHQWPQMCFDVEAICLHWSHSILSEPTFLNPWNAIERATDLAFELGEPDAIVVSTFALPRRRRPTCTSKRISFFENVQVFQERDESQEFHTEWMHLNDCTFPRDIITVPKMMPGHDSGDFAKRSSAPSASSPSDLPHVLDRRFPPDLPGYVHHLQQFWREEHIRMQPDEFYHVRTWYLHHVHDRICKIPRIVRLESDPRSWHNTILRSWRDSLHNDEPLNIAVAHPRVRTGHVEPVQADLLLTQGEHDVCGGIVTVYPPGHHDQDHYIWATSLPRHVSGFQILAGVEADVLLQSHACDLFHGAITIPVTVLPTHYMANGHSFVAVFQDLGGSNPSQAPAQVSMQMSHVAQTEDRSHVDTAQNLLDGLPDDHPDVASPVHEEVEESSAAASSSFDEEDLQGVQIFGLNRPVHHCFVRWRTYNVILFDILHNVGLHRDLAVGYHYMQAPLIDQHDAEEAILLQRVGDVPSGSSEALVLVDITYRSTRGVHNRYHRQVHLLSSPLMRTEVFHMLQLQEPCNTGPDQCELYHNNQLWLSDDTTAKNLQHGTYLRIVVTTDAAARSSSNRDGIDDCGPTSKRHRSTHPAEPQRGGFSSGPSGVSFIQHYVMTQKSPMTCSASFSSHAAHQSAAAIPQQDRPQGKNSNRKEWMPQAKMKFLECAVTEYEDEGPVFYWTTWYLHHARVLKSFESRVLRLDSDQQFWYSELCQLWGDTMVHDQDAQVVFVHPSPPEPTEQRHVGHLILVQGRGPAVPVLLSGLFDHATTRRLWHLAALLPDYQSPAELFDILGIQRWCTLRPCSVRCGHDLVPPNGLAHLHSGDAVTITIPSRQIEQLQDQVSLMQNRWRVRQRGIDAETHAGSDCPISQLNPQAPPFDPTRPDLRALSEFHADLWQRWDQEAFAWEEEDRSCAIQTWFVDHTWQWPHSRLSRRLRLFSDYLNWEDQLRALWRDVYDAQAPHEAYVVAPMPPAPNNDIAAHVILIQNPNDAWITNLATVLDTTRPAALPLQQTAITTHEHVRAENVVIAAELDTICLGARATHQCQVWFGLAFLPYGRVFPGRSGNSIVIRLRPEPLLPQPDGHSLLQTHMRRRQLTGRDVRPTDSTVAHDCRPSQLSCENSSALSDMPVVANKTTPTQLSLEHLLPDTEVAKLKAATQEQLLPTYIEIPRHSSEQGVHQELRHWGSTCTVYRFGLRSEYLCFDQDNVSHDGQIHYMLCHDDLADEEGAILHSSDTALTTNAIMRLLYQLNYTRAVIILEEELTLHLRRVRFYDCQPAKQQERLQQRQQTPWPEPTDHQWTQRPLYGLEEMQEGASGSACFVRTPFTRADIRELTQAATAALCTDFTGLNLPDFIAETLLKHGVGGLHDNWDRWLIFTDGSSQTKNKHHTPEYADAMNMPDAWAMLLLGERFEVTGNSIVVPIGWMAHPVRTDPLGSCYAGAQRIGADVAEREGLIWSGLWRLAQDCVTPTLFCVDSQVTGAQAFGQTGTLEPDLSFRLLRGIFQCLQFGLPHQHLGLHHVKAHTGDPYNEFVDHVAKREAAQSFNMPRMKLDMQEWIEKIPHLWTYFGLSCGMPHWCDGFDVPPPDLPPVQKPQDASEKRPSPGTTLYCQLSLATMNVCSISKGPEGHAGKLRYLYDQVKAHGLNVVGVQEGRNEPLQSTSHGICRISAGHRDGQYGVELWINLQQPIAYDQRRQPLFFQPHHFQVTHCDPQRLIVRCNMEALALWILVAHAPHSGHSRQDRETWWMKTQELIETYSDGIPWIWLIDANASPGEADQVTVFRDMPVSRSTKLFRQCLAANELCLPATMDCHSGTSTTWTSLNGQSEHCIDHIAIPQQWSASCTHSCVIDTMDLGNVHEDHRAVGLQLAWQFHASVGKLRSSQTKPAWNTQTVQNTLQAHFAHPCAQSWQTDVESQATQFARHLHEAMESCPKVESQAKKPYITDQLWTLRAIKLKSKKRLTEVNRAISRHTLQQTFMTWRAAQALPHQEELDAYTTTLLCGRLRIVAAFRRHARKLQQGLRGAKQAHLQERLEGLDASTPASNILQCLRDYVGPTNAKMCKKKTVPLIHNLSGQPCRTPLEAQDTWIEFFRDMEGGRRVSCQSLRDHWRQGLTEEQEKSIDLCVTELPTLTDLELAMRKTACGKARGGDDVPGELLHMFPSELSPALYPALWKLLLHGQEDLSYKGGLLVQTYKGKGATHSCSSFRSLLISSQVGKALHRTIRTYQATIFEKFLQINQVGGRRKMPVTYGLHQVRAHLRCAHRQRKCAAVVFIDLTEAFYRIFRPLCMDNNLSDEALAAFLLKLKMPESALHELWALLEGPNALEMANMPYHLRKSIAAIHRNTHFWMRHQPDVVETTFGSRPGDPFADVCFSYVWARVLHRLQNHMAEHDLLEYYPALTQLNLFGSMEDEHGNGSLTPFIGPTWMDDTAICLSHHNADGLLAKATQTAGKLLELCVEHGMSPNLKKGKSEVLLSIRGRDSRRHKLQLFGPHAPLLLPVLTEHQSFQIPIANNYLHLGGLLHHGADQRTELRRRLALAHSAFNQHRRVLYHNRQIPLKKRCELFQVLIVTKMLYGSESWLITDSRTANTFATAILKLYRRLLQIPPDRHQTTEQTLAVIGLPSPDTLLRRQRLRYLGTLFRCGGGDAWGLLSADQDWCGYVEADLQWMWEQLRRSSDLPQPSSDFGHWRNLIHRFPKYWKRLIRRATEHECLQYKRQWTIKEFHLDMIDRLRDHLCPDAVWQADDEEVFLQAKHFGCLLCGLQCASRAGEAAHMFKKHGHVAITRKLFMEPTCPACLKVFHTLQKTKAHLHYSARCRQVLQSRPPQDSIAPGAGSAYDRSLTVQHDRLLPPVQAEGPQNQPVRLREAPGIDDDFFVFLTDRVEQNMSLEAFDREVRAYAEGHPISWTTWTSTIDFFAEAFSEEDALFAGVPFDALQRVLTGLRTPDTFAFMRSKGTQGKAVPSVADLEMRCETIGQVGLHEAVPPLFGKHRVVLHAYSGRRRPGDVQFYLDKFQQAQAEPYILHIVSMDIVIDEEYGDARNPQTRRYWLGAIKERFVVALLAGPPCETWTAAREHRLQDGRNGPRPVRSAAELWGLACMRLKELQQVMVGNELLMFVLQAFLELIITGGCAIVEHPAPPPGQDSPSIWKLPVINALLDCAGVSTCKFAQGLLGAPTAKPTQLLLLNLPGLIHTLHRWRVCVDLPKGSAIGLDSDGQWRTSPLKEYPPAMCGALADSLHSTISQWPCSNVQEPSQSDLDLWTKLHMTCYGSFLGSDFAT